MKKSWLCESGNHRTNELQRMKPVNAGITM